MRLGTLATGRSDVDDLFGRLFAPSDSVPTWNQGGYSVPTDVFHMNDRLVIRMDLPGIDAANVEVTVQENNLLINGKRDFPYDASDVRFVRRGVFYGDFTKRVTLGRGLDVEKIAASYDNGILELSIPYSEEVQPKKISIEVGSGTKSLTS